MDLKHLQKASESLVHTVIIKSVVLLFLALFVISIPGKQALAFVSPFVGFGGRVTATFPCTCPYNPGLSITVVGPKGGQFFWSFFSTRPYAYLFPKPGGQMKGLAYRTTVTCMQLAPPPAPGCITAGPSGKLIQKFGTNLPRK